MQSAKNQQLAAALVDPSYVAQGADALKSFDNLVTVLLSQRNLPDEGWSDGDIERLLLQLSAMDSNNFPGQASVGEREARVFSKLVYRRHFGLGHGIGRSGDVAAVQPKAAGSSLINKLTNCLMLQAIRTAGILRAKAALVLPLATGMSIALCLLTIRQRIQAENQQSSAEYVVWARLDQKACVKAIYTAGFKVAVVPTIVNGDAVQTDLEKMRAIIDEIGVGKIAAVISTTSCFAPRIADDVEAISRLCKESSLAHVVNNAYGLQVSKYCHMINEACRHGRIDYVVQSTDKNLMVPVGGAIVCSPTKARVEELALNYPGRASVAPILDVFITLLSMGKNGFMELLKKRKEVCQYLISSLESLAAETGERLLKTSRGNKISFAFTLSSVREPTALGAHLFLRRISGARVVQPGASKTIVNTHFTGWGSSNDAYPTAYVTAAASIGMDFSDVDGFVAKLRSALNAFRGEDCGEK